MFSYLMNLSSRISIYLIRSRKRMDWFSGRSNVDPEQIVMIFCGEILRKNNHPP